MPRPHNSKNIVHGSITAGGHVMIGDTTYVNNYFAAQEVKIPHRLTNNIPTNPDHILGREAELATTQTYLENNQATVLFNGIGGIGKTSVASKYMALYGSTYKHTAWITVQSNLAEAFTNNAPLLASLQITEQVQKFVESKQLDKAFEYLFHQLNLLERTLVVIDNANDLDDLDNYKNWFDTATCHFLVTSRSHPAEWATVEIDALSENEAVRLFRKLHPLVQATDEALKTLLSKLFYHTLLIELVAKAGANAGIPFADLQTMINTQFIHHESLNEDTVPTGKHGSVVAINLRKAKIEDYILLIFNQLRGLEVQSKEVLKSMALLPVATPFDLDFLKKHFEFFGLKDVVPTLSLLVEQGWLQKEQGEGQKAYFKMHPLIADVVIKQLEVSVTFADKYIQSITTLIHYDNYNPKHNVFEVNKSKFLAERLCDLFFEENTEEMSELLHNLNWLDQNFGFYNKAVRQGERALAIAQSLTYENLTLISKNQSTLAFAYQDLGQYEKAAALLEIALETDLKNLGRDHSKVANRQSNLANVYADLGQYERAAVLLEAALGSNIKNFGKEHPIVAGFQSNLANVYRHLKHYENAVTLLERALASDLKNFGEDHPNVAIVQSNLGNVYLNLGQYPKAIALLERALASDLKNFGEDHSNVAICQYGLALVYKNVERIEEANTLWQLAYKNCLKNLGTTHPFTIKVKEYVEI